MKKDNGHLRMEKQAVIFDAALKVFRQKGFHKARIADIASEAGISYGLVYHYYHNKEGLFNTILNQWWEDLYQLLIETQKGGEDLQRQLRKIILYFLDTYQNKPDLIHILSMRSPGPPATLKPAWNTLRSLCPLPKGSWPRAKRPGVSGRILKPII